MSLRRVANPLTLSHSTTYVLDPGHLPSLHNYSVGSLFLGTISHNTRILDTSGPATWYSRKLSFILVLGYYYVVPVFWSFCSWLSHLMIHFIQNQQVSLPPHSITISVSFYLQCECTELIFTIASFILNFRLPLCGPTI